MPSYMELVERLERDPQSTQSMPAGLVAISERGESAEAIRSLLSLVGDLGGTLAAARAHLESYDEEFNSPSLNDMIQKAREATGEAEASPATMTAEN